MSLHEAAEGLLGTHVTWKDVEQDMQQALNTTATFGDNKKVTNISDMKGFMSRIALVEPDWINNDSEKELPKKFIVKISSQLPFIEMVKLMMMDDDEFWSEEKINGMAQVTRMLHNREVAVYKILMREKHPAIPFTKIYQLKSFDDENTLKAYIISEYIDNTTHIGMHQSISADDLIPVIKGVAAFTAIGERLPEEELEFTKGGDFLDIVFGQFLDDKTQARSEALLSSAFPAEYKDKLDKMFEINRKYYTNKDMLKPLKSVPEFFGYKPVLVHSDLWSSNLLCSKKGDGFHLEAIIDYQTTSISTPAQDVGRLFVACLSTKDRRERVDDLLKVYYDTFVEELSGLPVAYTFQQLKDSYNVYYPVMTLMVLPGIAPMLEHSQIPEEQKAALKEAALDKMVGMMEDVITTHEDNIKKFPDFYKF